MKGLWGLALLALLVGGQAWAGTRPPTETDVERWIFRYHQHPDIHLVPDAVRHLQQAQDHRDRHAAFVRGFLAGIFRKYPDKAPWLLDQLSTLPDERFSAVIMGLWLARLPDSATLVSSLIKSRRSGLVYRNLPKQPETWRDFIFTPLACGVFAATGVAELGPDCWKEPLDGLTPRDAESISPFGYVELHGIRATRNGPYVKKLLESSINDATRFDFVYASLQLLGLKEIGLIDDYLDLRNLERLMGLPVSQVGTFGDALALIERDPHAPYDLRAKRRAKGATDRTAPRPYIAISNSLYDQALEEIKKTSCLDRGSCSAALAAAARQ